MKQSLAGALVALLVLAAGCGSGDANVEPTDNPAGPLSVGRSSGDSQLAAPLAAEHWYAGFGSFVLCSEAADANIVLDRVRTASDLKPLEVRVFRREVSPDLVRRTPVAQRSRLLPRFTWRGLPPAFAGPHAARWPLGEWAAGVQGAPVSTTCAATRQALTDIARGEVPQTGFEELAFVLKVSRAGARITNAQIDYSVAGKPHTLDLRWVMVACGDRFVDPDQCRPKPPSG
ncbi:MAG: hypothetical protein JWR35_382 [Marmoricola sp.]|jgi:hypothetical protein|nr:hypothetical protein [Marmoricola sp.]